MLPYSGCLQALISGIICSVLSWSDNGEGPVGRTNLMFNTNTVPTALKRFHGRYKGENLSRLRDSSADDQ